MENLKVAELTVRSGSLYNDELEATNSSQALSSILKRPAVMLDAALIVPYPESFKEFLPQVPDTIVKDYLEVILQGKFLIKDDEHVRNARQEMLSDIMEIKGNAVILFLNELSEQDFKISSLSTHQSNFSKALSTDDRVTLAVNAAKHGHDSISTMIMSDSDTEKQNEMLSKAKTSLKPLLINHTAHDEKRVNSIGKFVSFFNLSAELLPLVATEDMPPITNIRLEKYSIKWNCSTPNIGILGNFSISVADKSWFPKCVQESFDLKLKLALGDNLIKLSVGNVVLVTYPVNVKDLSIQNATADKNRVIVSIPLLPDGATVLLNGIQVNCSNDCIGENQNLISRVLTTNFVNVTILPDTITFNNFEKIHFFKFNISMREKEKVMIEFSSTNTIFKEIKVYCDDQFLALISTNMWIDISSCKESNNKVTIHCKYDDNNVYTFVAHRKPSMMALYLCSSVGSALLVAIIIFFVLRWHKSTKAKKANFMHNFVNSHIAHAMNKNLHHGF